MAKTPRVLQLRKPTRSSLTGLVIKIVLLGLVDAIGIQGLFILAVKEQWLIFGLGLAILIVINYIYLSPKALPAKYLTPGLFFLAIFQVFVVIFTGYIAFTNYSDGHNSDKDDAISSIIQVAEKRVPDSPQYEVSVLSRANTFFLLVTDPDGDISIGTTDQPLSDADDAETDSTGKGTGLDGYETLNLNEVLANQDAILAISAPFSDDPNEGSVRTPDGVNGYVFKADLVYDEDADTFTDTTNGTVYSDNGNGAFESDSGQELTPGWRIVVGFDNFVNAFTNPQIGPPLLRVIIWTFVFAILSVLTTFVLGLFLAIVFNDPRVRFKNVFRVLMILPYAFPAFLSGLVFAGLLNPEFGFINQVFFNGAQIPWLSDPWLAKFSVLLLNLWLGYPYMFLICTGALQAIPEEFTEAARVDGASPWRVVTSIKLPLLLVSVAPLLIASFAFNFNNFNVIYMLTNGGPRFSDTTLDIGATDILITLVYSVAFGGGGSRDYGLASALSILIFVLVAVVSAISFRRTRALEDIY